MEYSYFRIYRQNCGLLIVVCVKPSLEKHFDKGKFFTNDAGKILKFDTRAEAIDWLDKNIKPEKIDPSCLKNRYVFNREDYIKGV